MSKVNEIELLAERVSKLEAAVFGSGQEALPHKPGRVKDPTLAELARGKSLKNGQQKVALIVGFLEKFQQKSGIKEADIKHGWRDGKIDANYHNTLLQRAIKDGLVRNLKDGTFDLSQSGEKFFDQVLAD